MEIYSMAGLETKVNCWFRRSFSLTGLYKNLSDYGESLSRPALASTIAIIIFTLICLILHERILTALQRSIVDFIPFVPLMSQTMPMDYFFRSFGVI